MRIWPFSRQMSTLWREILMKCHHFQIQRYCMISLWSSKFGLMVCRWFKSVSLELGWFMDIKWFLIFFSHHIKFIKFSSSSCSGALGWSSRSIIHPKVIRCGYFDLRTYTQEWSDRIWGKMVLPKFLTWILRFGTYFFLQPI